MSLRHTRSQVVSVLLGLVLVLTFAGVFFLPEIVSIYWHLRFGDSTTFHSWRVPVPRGWWAFTHEDQLIIQKMTRFYDREDPPGIIVGILSPSKPIVPEALKAAAIRTFSKDGYVFQEEKPIQMGTEPGYCLHFTTGKDQKNVRITCDSLAAHLSLDLLGRPSETQTFYSVVGQMRRQDMR